MILHLSLAGVLHRENCHTMRGRTKIHRAYAVEDDEVADFAFVRKSEVCGMCLPKVKRALAQILEVPLG